MRHRVKTGMVGLFAPEKQKVEIEQLWNREVSEWVEENFKENSESNNDDEALAAMDFHDSQTYWNNGLVTSYPHYMSTYSLTREYGWSLGRRRLKGG